jgi:hypothetical protein
LASKSRHSTLANFVLPHCCCDRKSDDTTNWNLLLNICFQCRDNAIEFVLRGAAITLIAFSDEPEASESDPSEIDWFSCHNDAVHRGGVRQDRFDISKIDADRHGTGSLQCARFSNLMKRSRSSSGSRRCPSRSSKKIRLAVFARG